MTQIPKRELMALSRAREKEALDWYAQNPDERAFTLLRSEYSNWLGKDGMKEAIKDEFAIAMGFDNWGEFCKSDNPERRTK